MSLYSIAKTSPDAYVQMVMQLAYYRQHHRPCATYESASTRGYLHGRTETVRSCSQESVLFTKTFGDKDASVSFRRSSSNGSGNDNNKLLFIF